MSDTEANLSRRTLLATSALAAFTSTTACAQGSGGTSPAAGKTLVAYVTRSGNTRVIAQTLHRALKADILEIRPARAYPEDYEEHVAQATRERESGYEPPLAETVSAIAGYEEIFLGFPIWGGSVPPPIRSVLKAHDLRDKTLRPFITHGGYGVGDAPAVLASHAPGARFEEAFVMEADQERRTLNQINSWLRQIEG
jgi:flavodoxin